MLEHTDNLDFYQDMVQGIIVKDQQVIGVKTNLGHEIRAKSVILTSGTFLNGVIHIGEKQFGGGRVAEKSATGITEQLVSLGFQSDRLKTGTPPRVDARSLNYSKMEIQKGDEVITGFSYLETVNKLDPTKQLPCHITYTNTEVHELLKTGFDRSPMYTGRIEGTGPRYCPSIEDKINRFADKNRHQLFVEPEGFKTVEIYVNGFSTSLPEDVQYKALRKVPGFENVKMFRPGYAIEYDYFPPTQLKANLETKFIKNLFFAGQINGTTGYEEAACQGLMAGINAHLTISEKEPLILKRNEAYIGVLIDDLISKGTDEPYRMFTSRAEYRTLLRQDNADLRLTELSHQLGLAKEERYQTVQQKKNEVAAMIQQLKQTSVAPEQVNPYLEKIGSTPISEKQKLAKIILRPDVSLEDMVSEVPVMKDIINIKNINNIQQSEIQIKYERYIEKEQEIVDKINQMESLVIPDSFDYNKITALGTEAIQKFNKIRPRTIGQAGRISGVNPADIQILMVHMGR